MRGLRRVFLVPALVLAAAAAWAAQSGAAPTGAGAGTVDAGAAASGGASLSYSTREAFEPNGFIRILVRKDGAWLEAARVAADEHLRSRVVDLSSWLSSPELVVRLEPSGPGASHLDEVLVEGGAPRGLDDRLARKLSGADNDVVDLAEVAGKDLAFPAGLRARLALTARIEPGSLGTEPVAFPGANTYRPAAAFVSFYRYRPGSNRLAPVIDGSLREERLGSPFFRETFPSGTGHPDSPTWAWVGDDGRTLYALLDVTADNTLDAGKDYARLHLRTPGGVRTYEVSSRDGPWGRSGFEYTDRVGWEHKVYEIAVPLAELAVGRAGDLDLAFTVYGTFGPPTIGWDADSNGVDPDSGASGTTFTFTVKFQDATFPAAPNRHDLWIDLDGDGVQDAGSPALPPLGGPWPWIAALALVAGAALIVAARRRLLPPLAVLAVAAALALAACVAPPTTQEIYTMSAGGADWAGGVVYTAEVPLVAAPGAYDFEFIFVNGMDNPVTSGSAVGTHTVVVE
jgi:hypothetical protein